jgi:hypothetical protein
MLGVAAVPQLFLGELLETAVWVEVVAEIGLLLVCQVLVILLGEQQHLVLPMGEMVELIPEVAEEVEEFLPAPRVVVAVRVL